MKKMLLSLVIILVLLLAVLFLKPTSPVRNLVFSNANDSKITLSWVTDNAVKNSVVVNGKIYQDTLTQGNSSLHFVTVKDLQPQTKYTYQIMQGWKSVSQGEFMTGPKLKKTAKSRVLTGSLLQADAKTPAAGMIIYVQLIDGLRKSSLYSTTSDSQGNWQIDILNLRNLNLKDYYKVGYGVVLEVLVDTGKQGTFKSHLFPNKNSSKFSVIILKPAK